MVSGRGLGMAVELKAFSNGLDDGFLPFVGLLWDELPDVSCRVGVAVYSVLGANVGDLVGASGERIDTAVGASS